MAWMPARAARTPAAVRRRGSWPPARLIALAAAAVSFRAAGLRQENPPRRSIFGDGWRQRFGLVRADEGPILVADGAPAGAALEPPATGFSAVAARALPVLTEGVVLEGTLSSGSFGHVRRGTWRGEPIAAKLFTNGESVAARRLEATEAAGRMVLVGGLPGARDVFVKAYGVYRDLAREEHGVVMEYASDDFWSVLRGEVDSPLPLVEVLRGVLEGLKVLEENGFVHRDIKEDNILFVWDRSIGRYRTTIGDLDFLCAQVPLRNEAFAEYQCHGSQGSPFYLAPEIWASAAMRPYTDGVRRLDFASPSHHKQDIFAAALMFLRAHSEASLWWNQFQPLYIGLQIRKISDLHRSFAMQAAEKLGRSGDPVYQVLSRMVHPDPAQRCSAASCLALLPETLPGPRGTLETGLFRRIFECRTWTLGDVWPYHPM